MERETKGGHAILLDGKGGFIDSWSNSWGTSWSQDLTELFKLKASEPSDEEKKIKAFAAACFRAGEFFVKKENRRSTQIEIAKELDFLIGEFLHNPF